MVFASPVSGYVYDRFRPRYLAALGMALMAIAFGALAILSTSPNILLIGTCFMLMGAGGALFQSPNSTEVMSALPREKAGISSSVTSMMRNLGMALGVSLGSVFLMISLSASGYSGSVLSSPASLLASSVSYIMVAACLLCVAASAVSLANSLVFMGNEKHS